MNSLLLPIISGAACLATGIGIGHFVLNPATSSQAQADTSDMGAQRTGRGFASDSASRDAASARSGSNSSRSAKIPASIQEALSKGSQSDRMQALLAYFNALSPDQLEDELAKLNAMPMSGERLVSSMLLFSKWGETDPHGALAAAKKLGFAGMMVRPTVMQAWAAKDPQAAANFFLANKNSPEFGRIPGGGPGMGRFSTSGTIAAEWAKSDPAAALIWAESLDGRDKSSAVASIFSSMATSDPASAAKMAASRITDEATRADAYRDIARQWAASDWNAAKSWADSLSGEEKSTALSSAISGLATTNPSQAAKEFANNKIEDTRLAGDIARQLSASNPQQAAEFLIANSASGDAENSNRGGANRSMNDVMSNFTAQNDSAALQFAQQQPAGSNRDSALSGYITSSQTASPAQKLDLAATIQDDRSRELTTSRVVLDYAREDPEAAKTLLQNNSSINTENKARLQQMIDNGGRGGRGGRGNRQ